MSLLAAADTMHIHRCPELPGMQDNPLEKLMKTRPPLWVTAAAVTFSFLSIAALAAILPRPIGATEQPVPIAGMGTPAAAVPASGPAEALVARGGYIARIAGCHDCHTEGYGETAGDVPAARWLIGSSVGFKGPWGVSYPTNLRLSAQRLTEAQWLQSARAPRLPPMPWFNLRDMSDEDLRALYWFIRSLGPAGEHAPAPVAPGAPVRTPYIVFEPQNLPVAASR